MPIRSAEPAKIIGWLLLAGWGTFALVETVKDPDAIPLTMAVVCFVLLAGFVQSHRHPGTRFARWWVAFFTGFIVLAAVAVKVAGIVL